MGGTGNTGKEPAPQLGAAASPTGSPGAPGWVGSVEAPGAVTGPATDAPLSTTPPTLRPYEEATASAGTGAGPATGLLAPAPANPMGFQHSPYPVAAKPVETFAAAAPPPAAAAGADTKDYTPKSFRPIWDAVVDATAATGGKGLFYNDQNWTNNPEAVRQWLQAVSDAGGDYRTGYGGTSPAQGNYNPANPSMLGGQKVYWPGDPARGK